MRSTINQYFMWQCLFDMTEVLFLVCETVQRLAITLSLSFRSKSSPANHSGLAHPFSSIFLSQKVSPGSTCKRETVLALLTVVCSEWSREPLVHQSPSLEQTTCQCSGRSLQGDLHTSKSSCTLAQTLCRSWKLAPTQPQNKNFFFFMLSLDWSLFVCCPQLWDFIVY